MTHFLVGDIVERPKGLLFHVGVHLGNGLVFHSSPTRKGAAVTSEAEFANGQPVSSRGHINLDSRILYQRVQTILARQEPYDAVTNNCEDVVTEVATGKRGRTVLVAALWLLAIAGVIALAARK